MTKSDQIKILNDKIKANNVIYIYKKYIYIYIYIYMTYIYDIYI